jgi:regulator of protease activity HflC (stomatin/prohibitin superfamily)
MSNVIQDRIVYPMPGYLSLIVWLLALLAAAFVVFATDLPFVGFIFGALVMFCGTGFFVVQPNQAVVMQFFGNYVGTAIEPGLRWVNPLYAKTKVSQRVGNFESSKLKVNDLEGSPIEIGAVIVWKVEDAAKATFQVTDYESFVQIQAESALRGLASHYPYDQHESGQVALRSHADEVAEKLQNEVQQKLVTAGVKVLDARITHLAYAPEIAQAMLQRQQATAVIAARTKIVEGAVSMVEMALAQLSQRKVVELDDRSKAQMVSNLLVVLCSEKNTQPVVNAGH